MAWKDLLPNLPSSVGGVISAGINYFSNRAANRENVALAQMQNQWNIDQWNRENFYNRPDQQMARLKAAGLNPNLVFANGDMMNEAASSPQMTSGAGMVRPYQIDPLTAAQIANINADTENKKGQTLGKEIENELGRMNLSAFKHAYDDGLVDDAIRAGFQKDILDSRMSRYSFLQAAWDFAVYTGFSLSESLTIGGDGIGFADFALLSDLYSPSYHETTDPKHPIYARFKLHSDLFSSNYEAQAEANRAAKKMAKLQQEENDKDFDIWKAINDAADKGETWAKLVRVGLWISNRFMKLPSFSLSIRGSDKSSHSTSVFNK